MNIFDNITDIKGIGPQKASVLKSEAGIETIEDLLYYIPRRYIDHSSFKKISDCFVNDLVTVGGRIIDKRISGRQKKRLEVVINDGSDSLIAVFFGAISYFTKIFELDDYVLFSGKINFFKDRQIVHPDFDFVDIDYNEKGINTGRIVPLYKSTEKLKKYGFDSRGFRRVIKLALDNYSGHILDSLDQNIIGQCDLIGLKNALIGIHFPDNLEHAERARKRLAFNEIFFLQYYLSLSRKYLFENYTQVTINYNKNRVTQFINSLSFPLTHDQKSAINDIINDISRAFPMNRLLQGDVGAGKTVVAMAASVFMASSNRQTAIMAPTEVLAQQHYTTFKNTLPEDISISLITGGTSSAEKKSINAQLANGSIDLVIGTHALIQETIIFKDLGLIVIDEQHRFGVNQRSALRQKGKDTDLLIMTATPIPRSLALTLYGDLDVTSIKTKPSNRIPVKTMIFPQSRLNAVYRSLDKYVQQGRQIFYILPLIEESEQLALKSAENTYKHLAHEVFPHIRVSLLHGRMKQQEKNEIMDMFAAGNIDILVSTTVIEVGIDIPNANVIVIEHAERFGLSQLHQLRGRVGRGDHESFCVLIHPDDIAAESIERLKIIESTSDGFIISEQDLKMRGSGEILGSRQHGMHGDFEFTDLSIDIGLIEKARDIARDKVSQIQNINQSILNFKNKKYDSLIDGIRKKRILSILS